MSSKFQKEASLNSGIPSAACYFTGAAPPQKGHPEG